MASNADDFARDLNKQADKVRADGEALLRRMGLDLLSRLVNKTPVGNRQLWKINQGRSRRALQPKGYVGGHLRHNWQVTINGTTDNELEGVSRNAAGVIRREQGAILKASFGSTIYIQNPVPYAQRVMEEGWSSQAPSGTFRVTIQEIAVGYGSQVTG